MITYEQTLRNEVVTDLGYAVVDLFEKAVKLHGRDPELRSMLAGAMLGAITELTYTIPGFKKVMHDALE